LPAVFLIYWFAVNKNLLIQNVFLLFTSYIFYGWWSWRFLFLLISVSFLNYIVGLAIENSQGQKRRKLWFAAGLVINLGTLCIFKYFNFFIGNFIGLVSLLGYDLPGSTLKIVLPLGISFYTFLSLSYIIDIYKKNLTAGKNIAEVLLSLSFFPIILAGPIQRPSTLLLQISRRREFIYGKSVDGLCQILWGLFVKIVIADNLAPAVDDIFLNSSAYSGSTLLLGIVFYTIQIYADFSGYSNIAIGVAKLFGFDLMKNFNYPYFSRDITEFWKKWHISLTSWFRDYIFLPLSFEISWKINSERVIHLKTDQFIYIIASFITWFLTGLWHGASYNFIIWGLINGVFLILYHLQIRPRKKLFKKLGIKNNSRAIVIPETIFTLAIIMLAWVFFRADSLSHAVSYIGTLFSSSLFSMPKMDFKKPVILMIVFLIAEWIQKEKDHALQLTNIKSRFLRWTIYCGIVEMILFLGGGNQKFIYFQF
jgi:D-alanyl-lipoteichoic acid acyltransferase DltB (MBOAT superfamily)